jgi:hypothetical protein
MKFLCTKLGIWQHHLLLRDKQSILTYATSRLGVTAKQRRTTTGHIKMNMAKQNVVRKTPGRPRAHNGLSVLPTGLSHVEVCIHKITCMAAKSHVKAVGLFPLPYRDQAEDGTGGACSFGCDRIPLAIISRIVGILKWVPSPGEATWVKWLDGTCEATWVKLFDGTCEALLPDIRR